MGLMEALSQLGWRQELVYDEELIVKNGSSTRVETPKGDFEGRSNEGRLERGDERLSSTLLFEDENELCV